MEFYVMCCFLRDWVMYPHCIQYPFPEPVGFFWLTGFFSCRTEPIFSGCRFEDETCLYGFSESRIKTGWILPSTLVALSFLATCRKQQAFSLTLCLPSPPTPYLLWCPCVDRAVPFPEVKGTKLRWQGRSKEAHFLFLCSSYSVGTSFFTLLS